MADRIHTVDGANPDGTRFKAMAIETDDMRLAREAREREAGALEQGNLNPDALRGLKTFIYEFNNATPEQITTLNEEMQKHVPLVVQGLIKANRIPRETLYVNADANHDPSVRQLKLDPIEHLDRLATNSRFKWSQENRYAWQNLQRLLDATARFMEQETR